jgi:hypothetical protein
MGSRELLSTFLAKCFVDGADMRHFLYGLAPEMTDRLPEKSSKIELIDTTIEVLLSEGRLNEAFFDRLLAARPLRASEINGIRRAVLQEPRQAAAPQPTISTREQLRMARRLSERGGRAKAAEFAARHMIAVPPARTLESSESVWLFIVGVVIRHDPAGVQELFSLADGAGGAENEKRA